MREKTRTHTVTGRLLLLFVLVSVQGCELSPWADGPSRARTAPPKAADKKLVSSKSTNPQKKAASRESDTDPGLPHLGMRARKGADASIKKPSLPEGYPQLASGSTKDGSPWVGGESAKVVIEEFSDFACPFCGGGARRMKRLLNLYGAKIRLVFRNYPLNADSIVAAEASLAAHAQGKFWHMHDLLYDNPNAHSRADLISYGRKIGLQMDRFTKDLDTHKHRTQVDREIALGTKKMIKGTPTFFINGYKVEGLAPLDEYKKLIDQYLKN